MRRSQKIFTLLRMQFESANQKIKFLAATRATRDVILKKPRSSGDENDLISFHRLLQFITAIDIFPDREEVGFLLIFHRLSGGSVRCRFCFSFKKLLHNLFTLLTLSNLLQKNYKWKDFSSDVSLRYVSFPSAKKMPLVEMTTC